MTTSCSSARLLVLLIAPLFACATTYAGGPGTPPPAPAAKNPDSAASHYGHIPLSFEANHGQTDKRVKFLSHGDGYSLFLTDQEAVLALDQTPRCPAPATPSTPRKSALNCETSRKDVLRMSLAGAHPNRAADPTGEDPLPGKVNYFLGNNPSKWHTGVPTYARVKYTGVYDGIDLVFYGNQRQLEHDFVVHPGADPGRIALSFNLDNSSSANLHIDRQTGDLVLNSGASDLRLLRPVTYQEINGQRHPISSSYKLLAGNRVSFSIGSYDHTLPLTIDPVLVYSTYLGGTGGDSANGIAVDANGNSYIIGTTNSTDFPVTSGALQSTNGSALASKGGTVFISKLNPSGTSLIYSTYLGGTGGDFGYAIALDSANNAYVTGATYSTDFPISCGAAQITNNSTTLNAPNAFVARLNATGSSLTYSTYLGGKGNGTTPGLGDVAQSIAVGPHGNAYVTGYTSSANFPVTDTAFQLHFKGNSSSYNAFVTELNPTGTSLLYSTYLGGTGSGGGGDVANGISLDAAGNAYVAGSTTSADFPITRGVFQTAHNASTTAFVTEVNPSGTDLVYSTFLGGTSGESARAIAVDSHGSAYVGGSTSSTDFPVTEGVVEGSSFGANSVFLNGFVTKLSPDGATLAYSTHLEGHDTVVTAIAVDSTGAAYVAGYAAVPGAEAFGGFHATPDGLPTPKSPDNAAFLVKLDPSAVVLNYATLFGGSLDDGAMALALDNAGGVYVAGHASSLDLPTSSGAFQTTNHAKTGSNAFIGKFALGTASNQTPYIPVPTDLGTYIVVNSANVYEICGLGYTYLEVSFTVYTNQPGPPLNGGYAGLSGSPGQPDLPQQVYGSWGSQQSGMIQTSASGGGPNWDYSAYFGGDSFYQASSIPLSPGYVPCTAASPRSTPPRASQRTGLFPDPQKFPATAAPWRPSQSTMAAAKFSAPLDPNPLERDQSTTAPRPQSVPSGSCTNNLPTLTITMNSTWRTYGAANPTFLYTTHGLLNGDTVTVTPFTTATAASPVGSYPITASVSGPAAPNYLVVVVDGALSVHKAVLSISAANVGVIYGHAPPPLTTYKLAGFVNGDTASVVSGAPILTTTVTAKTPVGVYPIGVQVGSLTATNYSFSTLSNGIGGIQVYKTLLSIQAYSVSTTYGQTPPPLTAYRLLGFVNGDTASVVTGAPILTTTITATTHPGTYPITVGTGSLAAANYLISPAPTQGSVLVNKAVLHVQAKNVATVYGQTPPGLTAYNLLGFVNGDTASVVTGAPTLSTTVTAATPVGVYQIGVQVGTLKAANYTFSTVSGGMGSVQVYKATLQLTANNLTMTQGSPVPPLTYTLSGFVNGDTAASSVTGAPALTTVVTSATKPGRYYIVPSTGTLTAHNYSFHPVYGVLTVLP